MPPLTAQTPAPAIPPSLPLPFLRSLSFPKREHASASSSGGYLYSSLCSRFILTFFRHAPTHPFKCARTRTTPVANSIRTDLVRCGYRPLFLADRQIDCGKFSVTLKNTANNPSRILSFTEFTNAFNLYTEVICTAFPHRRRELGDYLAIIAELALSYGGSHFYTYHKLFAAKCAIRVAQWNQCPYWGALDTELHNRVFLGCRNITCAVCRSISHSTIICPFINPSIPPCPKPSQPKSTSYVPRIPNI